MIAQRIKSYSVIYLRQMHFTSMTNQRLAWHIGFNTPTRFVEMKLRSTLHKNLGRCQPESCTKSISTKQIFIEKHIRPYFGSTRLMVVMKEIEREDADARLYLFKIIWNICSSIFTWNNSSKSCLIRLSWRWIFSNYRL